MLTETLLLAIIHAVVFLVAIGYAQNYYYHLRMLTRWPRTIPPMPRLTNS